MADTRKLRAFRTRIAQVWDVRESVVHELLVGARTSTARVNSLHEDGVEAIRDRLDTAAGSSASSPLEPVGWAENCLYIDDVSALVPLAESGRVYLQNASSLLPVVALDPQPGEVVLDVAAAPGGKAFHMAARMGGTGELWLNDAIKPRLEKLTSLARTYRVTPTSLTMHPAQYLDKELPPESFDRILLDVQCSGEGRIDLRRSDALRYWSLERIEKYTFQQTRMLDAAYKLLRPGGTMVYSTCTISPEENEAPVSRVLARHDDLDVVAVPFTQPCFRGGLSSWQGKKFDPRLSRTLRVMPTHAYEGFYAAVLTKRAG